MIGFQPVGGIFRKLGTCAAGLQLLYEHCRCRQDGLAPGQVRPWCTRPEAAVLRDRPPVCCCLGIHVLWAMAHT